MTVALERAAREFAEATALPPYLFDLGPAASRAVVEEIQARPVAMPAAFATSQCGKSFTTGKSFTIMPRMKAPSAPGRLLPLQHGPGLLRDGADEAKAPGRPAAAALAIPYRRRTDTDSLPVRFAVV